MRASGDKTDKEKLSGWAQDRRGCKKPAERRDESDARPACRRNVAIMCRAGEILNTTPVLASAGAARGTDRVRAGQTAGADFSLNRNSLPQRRRVRASEFARWSTFCQ
jgi:hypothetical protein